MLTLSLASLELGGSNFHIPHLLTAKVHEQKLTFYVEMPGKIGTSTRNSSFHRRHQVGFFRIRVFREVCRFGPQLLPRQARRAAVDAGRGEGAGEHTEHDAR